MDKYNVCLINDSFPPAIDGVANAVTNYADIIARQYGSPTVVTPYYPEADDSVYPFPVLRYPSVGIPALHPRRLVGRGGRAPKAHRPDGDRRGAAVLSALHGAAVLVLFQLGSPDRL